MLLIFPWAENCGARTGPDRSGQGSKGALVHYLAAGSRRGAAVDLPTSWGAPHGADTVSHSLSRTRS